MKKMRKVCIGGTKTPYVAPTTELMQVLSEGLMLPHSWNTGEEETNLPIHEGDANFGSDDDGRGAKKGGFWDDDYDESYDN